MSGFNPYNNYNDGTGYGDYNDNSAGGFNSQDDGNNKQQRQNLTQTITPVTIRTIQSATQPTQEGPYEAFGMPLYYVSFIGIIREIDTSNSSSTMYKLEDGTEAITVRQWNNDGEQDIDETPFKSGEYVNVCATIREFNNKKQLQTQSIRKITDFNEVSYHFLSAVKAFVDHKNGRSSEGQETSSSLFVGDNESQKEGQQKASLGNVSLTDRLYSFIKVNGNSMVEGVPTQLMAQEFNLPLDKINANLTSLVDEGKIFATDDESLYLCV
ncbi:DEKNAAC101320 [Brettanomyces naardenensis]|uniref:DEKNAAC101320 n=1 Tax=Brettanomyces naardenensis TaxID=13370 RepID=A0A448YHF3_BRENA|nr:DEKNAAC101320 [Brettanomyces naardenensis]